MSLMGSGFNGQQFSFDGYLPIDAEARRTALRRIEADVRKTVRTHIFIETPYRNNRLIAEMTRTLSPHIQLCVASDISGPRQSIRTMAISAWAKASYDYDKIPTIFLLGNS